MNIHTNVIALCLLICSCADVNGQYCQADRLLAQDRLWDSKKHYPEFNQRFMCQILDGFTTPSTSAYSMCVKKLIEENHLQPEPGSRYNLRTQKKLLMRLEKDRALALDLFECSRVLRDCYDVNTLKQLFSWFAPSL